MNKSLNSKKLLSKVKYIALLAIIIAAGFFSFDKTRIFGIAMGLMVIALEICLYRCPNFNASLDGRIDLDKNPFCPHCGSEIK